MNGNVKFSCKYIIWILILIVVIIIVNSLIGYQINGNILSNKKISIKNGLNKYKHLNDIEIPTLNEFKEQLLCPIMNEYPNNEILKIIYNNQFKKKCNSNNTKFFVHDISKHDSGIGSLIEAYISPIFWKAISLNRTYIIIGKWKWAKDYKYCKNTNGLECYTLPVSNCNYNEIIKYHKPKRLNRNSANNISYLMNINNTIISCNLKCSKSGLNRNDILKWFNNTYKMDISIYNVNGILFSYIFRINYKVRNIILNNIINIYYNDIYSNNYKYIIGWALRHSDKCVEETKCWRLNDYINLLKGLYYMNNDYNTFLITSEDHDMIGKIVNAFNSSKINIIYNKYDIHLKGGNPKMKITTNNWVTNVVVQCLTNFILQNAFSNVIIFNRNSNWLRFIIYSLNVMKCNSIFYDTIIPSKLTSCIEIIQDGINTNKNEKHKSIILNKQLFGTMDNKTFYNKFNLFLDHNRICGTYDISFMYK